MASYLVTALLMSRSTLTEKLSRRGQHLTREYGVDPLELVMVKEVMSPLESSETTAALPSFLVYADGTVRKAAETMATEGLATMPVIDRGGQQVCGTISLNDLLRGRIRSVARENERLQVFGFILPEQGSRS